MDDSLDIDWTRPKCTIRRPLLGITILLVEDSRYCSEAMRLLSIRSGARLRRADSVKSARRHLRIYRPDVVIIDVGLPDGSGVEIIRDIVKGPLPMAAIIATSGNSGAREKSLAAGAAYFMAKPVADLANFQQTVLAALPDEIKPVGFEPRLAGACVKPDVQALKDDLDYLAALLDDCFSHNDAALLGYIAQFLNSLGHAVNSKRMIRAAENIAGMTDLPIISRQKVMQQFQVARKVSDPGATNSAEVCL